MTEQKKENPSNDWWLFFIAAIWGGVLKVILFGTDNYGALPTIIWYWLCFTATKFLYNKYKSHKPASSQNDTNSPDACTTANENAPDEASTSNISCKATEHNSNPTPPAPAKQTPTNDAASKKIPSLYILAPLLMLTGALISLFIIYVFLPYNHLQDGYYKCLECGNYYYLADLPPEEYYSEENATADGYCKECTEKLGFEYCNICAFENQYKTAFSDFKHKPSVITGPYFLTKGYHYRRHDKNNEISTLCAEHFFMCYARGAWNLKFDQTTSTYHIYGKGDNAI